jgi:hypothetical protein
METLSHSRERPVEERYKQEIGGTAKETNDRYSRRCSTLSRVDPPDTQTPERPQWVSTARAGGILMLIGVPLVALHLAALWGQPKAGFLDMLTSISTGDRIDRRYLIGLALLGSGSCVVTGALIEAICVAIARFRARGRLRNP